MPKKKTESSDNSNVGPKVACCFRHKVIRQQIHQGSRGKLKRVTYVTVLIMDFLQGLLITVITAGPAYQ